MTQKAYPHFSEDRSAEVVNARMGADVDPRLKEVMSAIVRHLHAAVKEVEPSHDEWLAAIGFLTETGHMCTDWRQEFILLSDILGVSMLVDAVNHRRPSGATENTILGPFYVPEAPRYERGANICLDGKGEPLVVGGFVRDTEGAPVEGALIDVWQTNNDGFYDVQQKGEQPDWNLRGVFTSDAEGGYRFRSVKPRYYPIPDDGPVGKLLGRLGHEPVVIHVFAPDCRCLDQDAVFGVKESLIADFRRIEMPGSGEDEGLPAGHWRVDWDFVLTKSGNCDA